MTPSRIWPCERLDVTATWDGDRADPAEVVQVRVEFRAQGLCVLVDAPFHGDPPPDGPPGPMDRLWEHEAVEVFLLGDEERYLELALGPAGHHLFLHLAGRRRIVGELWRVRPRLRRAPAGRWRSSVLVPAGELPRGWLRANAYALHGLVQEWDDRVNAELAAEYLAFFVLAERGLDASAGAAEYIADWSRAGHARGDVVGRAPAAARRLLRDIDRPDEPA